MRIPRPLSPAVLLVCLTMVSVSFADGILVPNLRPVKEVPYFTIKYHHVKVEIEGQIATTYIDQVFKNESGREQQATYIFPLPPGAVVKDFTLLVDGKEMPGELLERDEAVEIYEEYVRKRKDPALLEYTGRNTYKARIFPVPARGERRVEFKYVELLPFDNGLVAYNYPMSTEKFSPKPIAETIFEAKIEAAEDIGTIYSPTHDVEVVRKGDQKATVTYEETNTRPDRDMLLYYSVAHEDLSASALTFKERDEDGYFLLLVAPGPDQTEPEEVEPKNVVFVLDRSGSMAGEKIEQAREALRFCVNSLAAKDTFQIFTFASSVRQFTEEPVSASKANIKKAREFIDEVSARGGTAMDKALHTALEAVSEARPNYIAAITDGLPTVGDVTDPDQIALRIHKRVADMPDTPVRIFGFGVGYDVDAHFIDKLSDQNGGVSTYVRPEESIEVKVSNWYSKIAQPVLTEVAVGFGDVEAYDTYPQDVPDLFSGSQLSLFGRYKVEEDTRTTVTVSGKGSAGKRAIETEMQFPAVRRGTDYIASLWASRKIGYLLDQIRLHGKKEELVEAIVDLSLRYGILTEYTAFLADEDEVIARDEAVGMAGAGMAGAFSRRVGAWATSQAQNAQRMRQQNTLAQQNVYLDAEGRERRIENVQNRGQRGFVNRRGQLQDTRYDAEQQEIAMRVQAYSDAYFQISRAFPHLNQFLALSDNMVVVVNGQAVEIGDEGQTRLTEAQLDQLRGG